MAEQMIPLAEVLEVIDSYIKEYQDDVRDGQLATRARDRIYALTQVRLMIQHLARRRKVDNKNGKVDKDA